MSSKSSGASFGTLRVYLAPRSWPRAPARCHQMDRVRTGVDAALAELKQRLAEITDLSRTTSVLAWDMEVYMPPAGADARGTQLATMTSLIHRQMVDDRIGELLDELAPHAASLPADSDDAALIRVARRRYEKLVRVPPELTAELTKAQADGYTTWVTAREEDDFGAFRPALERLLDV